MCRYHHVLYMLCSLSGASGYFCAPNLKLTVLGRFFVFDFIDYREGTVDGRKLISMFGGFAGGSTDDFSRLEKQMTAMSNSFVVWRVKGDTLSVLVDVPKPEGLVRILSACVAALCCVTALVNLYFVYCLSLKWKKQGMCNIFFFSCCLLHCLASLVRAVALVDVRGVFSIIHFPVMRILASFHQTLHVLASVLLLFGWTVS